jgi:hypothetical protein
MRDMANGMSIADRWALMAPYWPFVRNTGYGQAMRAYMRDLFGVGDIDGSTVADLSERIREAHARTDWYRTVLKDKARIATSLLTRWPGQHVEVDREFFRAVPILDHFVMPSTRKDLLAIEQETNCSVQNLNDLINALETRLAQFVRQGIVGIKIFLAYRRTLLFEQVTGVTANRHFNRLLLSDPQYITFEDQKPLQDYEIQRLIVMATNYDLPIQIHTGLQEGNGNYIENSKPTLLTSLFMSFPNTRFDVFHAGYPYTGEVAVLAKNFPNVYADLCWVPAISPHIAARTLRDWLDTIPSNKILAVGGDSNYVEGAYGHCGLARRIVCDALAERVEAGLLGEDEAVWLAQRLLRENAVELFRLTDLG